MRRSHALFLFAAVGLIEANALAQQTINIDAKLKTAETEWKPRPTLVLEGLTDFRPPATPTPLSRFGGRTDKPARKATGFFRVDKQDGRWAFVDPDGHSFYSVGVNSVNLRGTATAQEVAQKEFGSPEKWAAVAAKQLRDYGFNTLGCWSQYSQFDGEAKLPYTVQLDFASRYAYSRGKATQGPGQTKFPNNAMPIFDAEFAEFCRAHAKKIAEPLKDDPWLIGYYTDNELPFRMDALDSYLKLPETDAGHQAARKWIADHGGEKSNGKFLVYVAETYFSAVTRALREADPNHLSLGSRLHGRSLNYEGLFGVVGKHVDAIAINYYNAWSPDAKKMADWTAWSGRPFLITEWYAKGVDSGMPNFSGAGWLVKTQEDRGRFYQNFALGLMNEPGCVGWHWFKYMDNDPGNVKADPSNQDSNKGIVNARFEPYAPLTERMTGLNRHTYNLVDYFDARAKTPSTQPNQ